MKHINLETQSLIWTVYAAGNYKISSLEIKNRLSPKLKKELSEEDITDIIKNMEYQLYMLEEELKYQAIYGEYHY